MNFKKACKILNITEGKYPLDEVLLKKNYHIQALKYHPDKYNGDDANEKFQSINYAYKYLLKEGTSINPDISPDLGTNDSNNNVDYSDLLRDFLSTINQDEKIIGDVLFMMLNKSMHSIFNWIVNNINKEVLLKTYTILKEYNEIFQLPENILVDIYETIKEKYKNEDIIIINPSMKDLFNQNIYVLKYNNHKLYIPLWHHELFYNLEGKRLTVKCVPDFLMVDNNYYDIDCNNNIHINHTIKLDKDIFRSEYSEFMIDYKQFKIPINELKIKEKQIYIIKEKGVPRINESNIYSTDVLSDIIINITME